MTATRGLSLQISGPVIVTTTTVAGGQTAEAPTGHFKGLATGQIAEVIGGQIKAVAIGQITEEVGVTTIHKAEVYNGKGVVLGQSVTN